MADHVHSIAKDGFKHGSFYDQNRPTYTDELVSCVKDNLYSGIDQGVVCHILELGAGSGKFTKKILEILDKGCSYLASEPLESFLSLLKENVPAVDTIACSAADIPLPDNSVQNVICAQSFHWFATEESLTEMTRVLVPEGRLILVWNIRDRDVDWVRDAEDVLTLYYSDDDKTGAIRPFTKKWKTVIEEFAPLSTVDHVNLSGIDTMKGDKTFVLNNYSSESVIARLDAKQKEIARQQFLAVLDKHFRDDQEIHIPFTSELFCAKKVK